MAGSILETHGLPDIQSIGVVTNINWQDHSPVPQKKGVISGEQREYATLPLRTLLRRV